MQGRINYVADAADAAGLALLGASRFTVARPFFQEYSHFLLEHAYLLLEYVHFLLEHAHSFIGTCSFFY